MGRTILAYIEIENDSDYKFHICEISNDLTHIIRMEDNKVNVMLIKINWKLLKKR